MSSKVLQETVMDLQRRVNNLEAKLRSKPSDGWKRTVGAATNDTHFAEAMKLGAEWRKKANQEKW